MVKNVLFWLVLAQGADITTSVVGIRAGCKEALYPVKSAPGIAIAKGGSTIAFALTWGGFKKKKPMLAKVVIGTLIASGTFGSAWNLKQLPNCGK